MAKKTPDKLIVTWDELADRSAVPELKKFLQTKELTSIYRPSTYGKIVDATTIAVGQRSYEKHLNYLRRLSQVAA
jgi:hypothetical protein